MKWALSLVLGVCCLVVAVLFNMTPLQFFQSLGQTFSSYDTYKLLAIVTFILLLSNCLRAAGALDDMVGSVSRIVRDNRVTLGMLPALIGFLPMPGGALFSAPMIEGLADEAKLEPESRTFINYWFRHVWEYSYPLYPGLLLSATILKVPIGTLTVFQFPLCLAAILAGAAFGLLRVPRVVPGARGGEKLGPQFMKFFSGFWPVLLVVLGIFAVPWEKLLGGVKFDPLMVILPVVVVVFGFPRLGPRRFLEAVTSNFDWRLLLTVTSVLLFKDVIGNSGAAEDLSGALQAWGIPELALFLVLPTIMGYLTGITHSYVSVAFPLLMPFFTATTSGTVDLSKVQLAYASGFVGVILSPVHLCLVLSSDYFRADLNKVVRRLYAPAGFVWLVSLALYYLT